VVFIGQGYFFFSANGSVYAEVEIEAYLVRPLQGDIVWSKKIGYREVRIPFTSDDFSSQSQEILNSLLEKTLRDLFRNSDFRLHTQSEKNSGRFSSDVQYHRWDR
jgi:hypothetical protein